MVSPNENTSTIISCISFLVLISRAKLEGMGLMWEGAQRATK